MWSVVLFGAFGLSGVFYFFLKSYWYNWYLDYMYRRASLLIAKVMLGAFSKGLFLIDIFENVAAKNHGKTFIIYENKKYSYGFVDKKANQVVRAMVEIGVKPGDTVAVLIYNEPAIIWTYLGLMKLGCPIAFINFNLRSRPLAHCINISECKVLIVGEGEELVSAVKDVAADIPGVTVYLQGATSQPKPPSFLSLKLVTSRVSQDPVDRALRKGVTLMDTCSFFYTSGTTGLPKAAHVLHSKTLGAAFGFDLFGMTSDDIVYEPLPMYHAVGCLIGLGNVITHGATMVLKDKFSATQFWEDCRKYDVTIIQYIGEMCRYLVARPKDKMDGVHTIRHAFGNGLRQDIWREFQDRFKIPKILEFYGATEGLTSFANVNGKVGAVGRSSPYLRKFAPCAFVKFDLESQSPLRNKRGRCIPIGPDEVGLLIAPVVKNVSPFPGYKNKAATEKKLLHNVFKEGDTWFDSGDLFRVDRQYYIYFNDRVGDTFRWKGENVSTTEVSNILTELDFIQDANVYGVTMPGGDGRAGMAAITLTEDGATTLTPSMLAAISNHVTKVLPSYAQPKFIRVKGNLDITSTFKQQKVGLVREGFDVNQISEPVFYLNIATKAYAPLDDHIYSQIMAGKIIF